MPMARTTSDASAQRETADFAGSWFTAAEAMTASLTELQNIRQRQGRAVSIGVPGLRDYFAPLLPGQVCAVIAQTSQYKSGFLHCVARHITYQLAEQERKDIIVHVSVEESIEEQGYLELAREADIPFSALVRGDVEDWDMLTAKALQLSTLPIVKISDSIARASNNVRLYLSNVERIIDHLRMHLPDAPRPIASIFVDYLQALPLDPAYTHGMERKEQRRLQVREDMYRLRQMSMAFDCPIWVAVQAKQKLDGARGEIQMPGVYDAEETSAIAQRCDRILQLWMPKMTHRLGQELKVGDQTLHVAENDLFVRVGKQRGGLPSGRMFHLLIDFQKNELRAAL